MLLVTGVLRKSLKISDSIVQFSEIMTSICLFVPGQGLSIALAGMCLLRLKLFMVL